MAKPTIVARAGKGSALTWTEGDANVTNLRDATVTVKAGTGGTDVVSDLNGTVTLVAGTNVTITGDNTAKTVTINSSGGGGGLADVVDDTTPQLGGALDVNGQEIVSVSNGAITLAPNGSGLIVLNKDGTGAVVSRRSASTGTISNAIVLQRNYTADVIANMDGHASAIAFSVRDSAAASSTFSRVGGEYAADGNHAFFFEMSGNSFTTATRIAMLAAGSLILGTPATSTAQTLTTIDTQDLVLNTNFGTDSGSITITDGANGDITISPNGTGDVHIITDALRIGDLNTEARISTYGTGNLVLTTNEGNDPDPIITIGNGANANITLTPSGTGKVIIAGDLQVDGTTTTVNSTTLDVDDINITIAKGAANAAAANGGGITLEGPTTAATITYASADDSWNLNKKTAVAELQVDNINVNTNTISVTEVDGNLNLTANGTGVVNVNNPLWVGTNRIFSNTGQNITIQPGGSADVLLSADTVQVGDLNTAATITTNGTGNLTLNTNSGTTSGSIVINQGTNGNIAITPDGTGDVQLVADTVQIGDLNTTAVITTNGTGSLQLSTNNGTSSGTILINSGANGNFEFSPAGTGDVYLNSDTVRIGDANITATLTTNSSGSLVLNTNAGSNSGNITINQGVNGNISITPNGTGIVVLDGINWPITGGTNGYALTTNGSNQASWSQLSLTAAVTGTLPIANGGTGATTAQAAYQSFVTYTATNAATVTLTNTSNYIQHIYGGTGTVVTLPSTDTMNFGYGFLFYNNSGATTTVNTSTGLLLATLPTGTSMYAFVTNTGSNAVTSWLTNFAGTSITGTGSQVLSTSPTITDLRETVYAIGNSGATTLTPNAVNGNIQTITATGNFTLSAFTSPVSGQTITFIITQDATGSRLLTSTMKFEGGSKTLSTAANSIDILTVSYIGTTYYASLTKGYA